MSFKIQMRRDTEANWAAENPTLDEGEFGFESDTGLVKIGDGSTAWNSLDYLGVASSVVPWTTIVSVGGSNVGSAVVGPTTFGLKHGTGMTQASIDIDAMPVIPFVAADYQLVGLTAEFRIAVAVAVNNTAPAVNFTVGLHNPSALAGGANTISATINAAVASVAVNAPAANAVTQAFSTPFAAPADAAYIFCAATSGTTATNSDTSISAFLQVRHV